MDALKKKILIADESSDLLSVIKAQRAAAEYLWESASNGIACLEKIASFQPHLILLDLQLPKMHGIEILKTLKGQAETKEIGVIICSFQPLIQNYHASVTEGAAYFLIKPFESSVFLALVERFFNGTLRPDPFKREPIIPFEQKSSYSPTIHTPNRYLKFWGTRGSTAVSGAEYMRYGGNTSCLEIHSEDDLVIIDAGTGIRPLGHTLHIPPSKTIHLVLSHTHWDHITGFPFFIPLYNNENRFHLWAPVGFEKSIRKLFTEMLAYTFFPMRLDEIQANLHFEEMRDGQSFSIGSICIDTHYAYHPGSTLCFKIRTGGKTFGYATDNEVLMGYYGDPREIGHNHPLLLPYQSQIAFFKNCDFLIHEAQYIPKEYVNKVGWGHSSISNATVLIKHSGVKHWIVTHHDPQHTDKDLQKKVQLHRDILEECELNCSLQMAYDGLFIPL